MRVARQNRPIASGRLQYAGHIARQKWSLALILPNLFGIRTGPILR